jgi:pilus assembly protein Flp/PilA
MKKLFAKFIQDESGASLIEYVLIAALISIVGIGLMISIGSDVSTMWFKIDAATTSGSGG